MARFKKITDVYGMKVFTDTGYFFGEVGEALIKGSKIESWKIDAVAGSLLSEKVKDARGVIVPQNFFKAFGDIIIIKEVEFETSNSDNLDE